MRSDLVPGGGRGVCLDCRTLLDEGQTCDGGRKHWVVQPHMPGGRELLLAYVWGPPDKRQRARQLVKAGGSGTGFALVFKGCLYGGVDALLNPIVALAALGVGLLVASLYWLVSFIVRNVQAHQGRLAPRGALARPRTGRRTRLRGRAVAGPTSIVSPGFGEPCLAYHLELTARRHEHSGVMLRRGEAAAFIVRLDDGSEVEIPAGNARLRGRSRSAELATEAERRRLRAELGLPEPSEEDLDPFPFDEVHEVVVRAGDRVELFGKLVREPHPRAEGGSPYRQQRFLYRPAGTPSLQVMAEGG